MKTTKMVVIDGIEVEVTVCKPSRRRAASSIQKPRYSKNSGQRGAKWIAVENGQIEK